MDTSETTKTSASASRSDRMYNFGNTTVYSHKKDPRFAYTLYVPKSILDPESVIDLIVVVHGSNRRMEGFRDRFSEFAKWHNCVVLSPLFPANVCGDDNRDGYKQLCEGTIRYDQLLLDMIAEIEKSYQRRWETFGLFGFSGGGQFTNRFCLLHPERLWAASIGAPGSVTLLDPTRDWWIGTRDVESHFGKKLDVGALRKVPIHMVVGKADLETWEIAHQPGGAHYMPGANDAGRTRPERLKSLKNSFESHGINVALEEVENATHRSADVIPAVQAFFARVLASKRERHPESIE
jgi:predicted peptidase